MAQPRWTSYVSCKPAIINAPSKLHWQPLERQPTARAYRTPFMVPTMRACRHFLPAEACAMRWVGESAARAVPCKAWPSLAIAGKGAEGVAAMPSYYASNICIRRHFLRSLIANS
jgi:hypothetical protein